MTDLTALLRRLDAETGRSSCIHAVPQAPSCLHGVCIFCYRERLGALRNALPQIVAALEAGERELIAAAAEARTCFDAGHHYGFAMGLGFAGGPGSAEKYAANPTCPTAAEQDRAWAEWSGRAASSPRARSLIAKLEAGERLREVASAACCGFDGYDGRHRERLDAALAAWDKTCGPDTERKTT